jgi:hypothetical protein
LQNRAIHHPSSFRVRNVVRQVQRSVLRSLHQSNHEVIGDEMIKLTPCSYCIAKACAVHDQAAHQPKGAWLDRAAAKEPEFIARRARQDRDELCELSLGQPSASAIELVGRNSRTAEKCVYVETCVADTAEQQLHETRIDSRA